MASLLTARRKHLAAARGFHARAETVGLRAAAAARLKRTLWQCSPFVVRNGGVIPFIRVAEPPTGLFCGWLRIS